MKVLLISHTVLSGTGNMGKTFLGYLSALQPGKVAQLYIHSEVPTDDSVCRNYYRFTDVDALKSIAQRWRHGSVFGEGDICSQRDTTRTDAGLLESVYVKGSRRRASTMALRELVWRLGSWKSRHLLDWVEDFLPDVVLLASGDYGFMYDIARSIADHVGKPLVTVCVDDYYFHNRNAGSLVGRITHCFFMKSVHKTMQRSCRVFCICDKMTEEYGKRFSVPCYTLHTGAQNRLLSRNSQATKISYIGNLGFGRYQQLVQISRALQRVDDSLVLDVYSAARREEEITAMKAEPGIRFHGSISAEEVLRVMENSMLVIHTESFEEKYKAMTRFSVSTKIAESLMYGPCMLAYGPEDIASIDYLKKNEAAFVITSPDELESGLQKLVTDASARETILQNARKLARENHGTAANSEKVAMWLAACLHD